MKAILAAVAVVVLAIVGYLGWQYYKVQRMLSGPAAEIASESINRSGDTWQVSFVSRFDAPVDKVYEVFQHPEEIQKYMPDNILKSELVSQNGNTKIVDVVGKLDILPPGFKVQNLRTEWQYTPDQKAIATRSLEFKLADLNASYRFEPSPDGKGTVLRYNQTSKDKAPMIVESLQKGALRETYLWQIKAANKRLGLVPADAKKAAAE